MFRQGNTLVQFRSRLTGLSRDTGWYLGLNQRFFKNARGARILVYHGICHHHHLRFNTLFIKLKTLESQLRLYKRYFNFISLDDFYQQRFDKEKFNICLTFDDGFANNYKYVLPLLEKYKIPAVFFVTGIRKEGYDILWNDVLSLSRQYGPAKISFRNEEFIKGKDKRYRSSLTGEYLVDLLRSTEFKEKAWVIRQLDSFKNKVDPDYWLQMTEGQIRTLSQSEWVTIGSHSSYHNDLAEVSVASAKEDLNKSKQFLESLTGKEIKALAFPYGSYTREMINEAKQAGFTQLLATEFLFREDEEDATMRERLTINPFISDINQMHANITGNYK